MIHRVMRHSVAIVIFAVVGTVLVSSCSKPESTHPKVIVLGFDGMDPRLCERLMDAGDLPNLATMRKGGGFRPLGTSIPPQSPVAWASFITGANPGVHGIFDFIHRNPEKQCLPYYSAAETVEGDKGWDIGRHNLPLSFWPFNHQPTQTLLRRDGKPFWDYLDDAGIPTRFYDIPANYPPSPSRRGHMCCLSGMGVPDLHGTYGTYQWFSETVVVSKTDPGGMRKPIEFTDHGATVYLVGPRNSHLKRPVDAKIALRIYRHPTESSARIEFQGQTVVLGAGGWSDWCKVDFELRMPSFLPNAHATGIVRFYLQEVHPNFSLYVTPINIDPSDPGGQTVSEPADFVTRIADEIGLFHTAGFQEDHKALSNEVFTDAEYHEQAEYVLQERINLLKYATNNYEDGLLFFYFSSTDLQGHMFWWNGDDPHPLRSPAEAAKYNGVLQDLYKRMDAIVGGIVERYGDEATILVMSDHGFCNFKRQFNLNTWLRDNGYLYPSDARSLLNPRLGAMVDWSQTRAYGLGLNGLYVNLSGRERDGIVESAQRDALLDEISEKLLAERDPASGRPVVKEVYRSDEIYSGPNARKAPDLIVGYHRGYRASWATTLGDITDEVLADNDSAWSADHCIAADQVPGVIFSNRPIRRESPDLTDLAPTILSMFGVEVPETMTGGDLFRSRATVRSNDSALKSRRPQEN